MALKIAAFKRGLRHLVESFRQIMVESQFSLLQEGILFERLFLPVRAAQVPGQSGHVRGVEDPHLLFHQISADVIDTFFAYGP